MEAWSEYEGETRLAGTFEFSVDSGCDVYSTVEQVKQIDEITYEVGPESLNVQLEGSLKLDLDYCLQEFTYEVTCEDCPEGMV